MTGAFTVKFILEENEKRFRDLHAEYNPLTGEGAPLTRRLLYIEDAPIQKQYVPETMFLHVLVARLSECGSVRKFVERFMPAQVFNQDIYEEVITQLTILRFRHDFTFWAYTAVRIKPKEGGDPIPFKLNYAQLKLLEEFEYDRLHGIPIRIIICKARQWGGSTLTQMYMAWIQLCHRKGWYSTIVAQTKTVSNRIMTMYEKMITEYPVWALELDEGTKLQLSHYGKGGINDYTIKDQRGRSVNDTVIQIGTVQEPDNIRGGDVALIHYSEVGVWKDTPGRRPEDLIRSLSGGLLHRPYTAEVLESTPKGTGNFFHREYMRAKEGKSSRKAFFIPWYYILNDTIELDGKGLEEMALWLLHCRELGETEPEGYADEGRYYWWLWEKGATLQGIAWYREVRKSLESHADMASEAPSDDIEAFENSGMAVFDKYQIDEMRKSARDDYRVGEVVSRSGELKGDDCLKALRFRKDDRERADLHKGFMKLWAEPETELKISDRYLVVVDIGGRWKKADYSVITVFDRFMMTMGGKPEVVAEWRGHIDHDLLAWKAAQIAAWYCNAKLVIESNTLETKDKDRDTEGNDIEYILEILSKSYGNLYAREKPAESIPFQKAKTKWGFHTNTNTKPAIINHMIDCLRDQAWVERCTDALDEMGFYEKKDASAQVWGAVSGQHDDMVMTRAIGLWICFNKMPMPKLIETQKRKTSARRKRVRTEADI